MNMKAYKFKKPKFRTLPRNLLIVLGVILFIVFLGLMGARKVYMNNLQAVDFSSAEDTVITIPSGSSLSEIAAELRGKNVIRSTWAFNRYVTSNELGDDLKAGTYRIKQSYDVQTIVDYLLDGKIAVDLFTIYPASTLRGIRQEFIDKGFDTAAIERALDANNYPNHPALVDKPAGADLEGYLYPESFHRTAETSPETIIAASLDEMAKRLTAELRAAFAGKGLNAHQAVILASIVEKEVPDISPEDRPKVAQVFLRRLKENKALESDATTLYGAAVVGKLDGLSRQEAIELYGTYESAYNTYKHKGLTPTPISNVSESSLKAVAFPAGTNFLYFLTGDDCKTYFSNTLEEHESNIDKHLKKGCGN